MLILHDPRAFDHNTGPGHPERAERLRAVIDAVTVSGRELTAPNDWIEAKTLDAIHAVHSPDYVARLRHACERGARYIDAPDSAISSQSFDAALAAVRCALTGVDAVLDGREQRAFIAMRPPGHHCEYDRSMGFCLLNTIAVAAHHLIRRGIERVAIVDFDVHHGNGTQHLFDTRDDVFYISTHQHPDTLYPGTGFAHETGAAGTPGAGYTLNVPLAPYTDDTEATEIYERVISPRLLEYEPEVLLISAGFDADARDPLASLRWSPLAYERITRLLRGVAEQTAGGRMLSVLEGGYHLDALAEGVTAHLNELD